MVMRFVSSLMSTSTLAQLSVGMFFSSMSNFQFSLTSWMTLNLYFPKGRLFISIVVSFSLASAMPCCPLSVIKSIFPVELGMLVTLILILSSVWAAMDVVKKQATIIAIVLFPIIRCFKALNNLVYKINHRWL